MNEVDMSIPVTRGELQEEIERLETRLASNLGLEIWGSTLLAGMQEGDRVLSMQIDCFGHSMTMRMERAEQARLESEAHLRRRLLETEARLRRRLLETEARFTRRLLEYERRLSAGLAQQLRAANEEIRMYIAARTDKYSDRPWCGPRLESAASSSNRR